MPIRAIAYTSRAIPGLTIGKIDAIARQGAAFNLTAGLTGVMLYDGGRFLQYIEGPEDRLREAFRRVLISSCHGHVHQYGFQRTSNRIFPWWPMRWIPTDVPTLSEVADGDWTVFDNGDAGYGAGVDLLMKVVAHAVQRGLVAASVPDEESFQ